MDNLPWWKVKRVFKVVKNAEIFQSGFIVMGNRPKWKMKKVFKEVWLLWVTYPGGKDEMSEKDDMIGLYGERELKSALKRR